MNIADEMSSDYKVELDAPAADTPVECGGGCSWSGEFQDLKQIEGCSLTPGDASPAGRCPSCDALAYVKEKARPLLHYRGVPVFVSKGTRPNFYAHANGDHYTGGSYDTLRKKLDAALVFEPFDALILGRSGVEEVRIINVDMESGEWIVEREASIGRGPASRRIKFYTHIYPVESRDKLELFLANCEVWDKTEADIKEARTVERQALEGQAIKRPDGS